MKEIKIFDTTLRDGEQSPGASMNVGEKLQIAKQLARLGVDIIEAGFAISSSGDFEAIKTIAGEVEGPVICSLARAIEGDIKRAWEAIKDAPRKRIHTFHSTSENHLTNQHRGMSQEEALKRSVEAVLYAKSLTEDVEFSPMDATRTEIRYLCEVLEAVIKAGATTVNVPDTVGYSITAEFGGMIKFIRENVKNINQAVISVHCHNDLGLSTANSLAAVLNGAGQVECTVNGIGERAGNAALDEVVMAIETRSDVFDAETNIVTEEIMRTSKLITKITGIQVQPNKAIVGNNAFAHASGIHQDGLLKDKSTYEIIRPETVGVHKTKFVLGKLSGRKAIKERYIELGYELTDKEIDDAFKRFKALADKKKDITDEDLVIIAEEDIKTVVEHYKLEELDYGRDDGTGSPWAKVTLKVGDRSLNQCKAGVGPVDAIFKAIVAITCTKSKEIDYRVEAVTEGTESLADAYVIIKEEKITVTGNGRNTDSIEASTKAYINALNKLHAKIQNGVT